MSMNHTVYPVGNFKFGTKAAKEVKYPTVDAQMERLQTKYQAEGPRRSVDAVLVVHQVSPLPIRYLRAARKIIIVAFGIGANRVVVRSLSLTQTQNNHPHILLLQAGPTYFKLPGGRLRPGEEVSSRHEDDDV